MGSEPATRFRSQPYLSRLCCPDWGGGRDSTVQTSRGARYACRDAGQSRLGGR